jgi:hypothetical protein
MSFFSNKILKVFSELYLSEISNKWIWFTNQL